MVRIGQRIRPIPQRHFRRVGTDGCRTLLRSDVRCRSGPMGRGTSCPCALLQTRAAMPWSSNTTVDVYSCDHFVYPEYRLGNIKDHNLRSLYRKKEQFRFGMDKRNTLPSECLNCRYYFACRGGVSQAPLRAIGRRKAQQECTMRRIQTVFQTCRSLHEIHGRSVARTETAGFGHAMGSETNGI